MADPIRLVPPTSPSGPELPHNIEAEAALLGALMIDNRIAEDFQQRLRPDHFFEAVHGRVYDAILRLLDRNMVANPVTLRPMFSRIQPSTAAAMAGALQPVASSTYQGGGGRADADTSMVFGMRFTGTCRRILRWGSS